jgi:hypothetical protein
MKSVGLIRFLKGTTDVKAGMPGCANYDHHHGGCLFSKKCKVEQGKRCSYFERAVLPTAADIGRRDGIYYQYESKCNVTDLLARPGFRLCPDCGADLKLRERYCKNCSRKRRQATNRASQKKYRTLSRTIVSS